MDGEWNRLDAQELSFYQRVEAGYRQLIGVRKSRRAGSSLTPGVPVKKSII